MYRYKNYRFFVNSREETRRHVHVQTPDGEAKFWLEPEIQLAQNFGIKENELNDILKIIGAKADEFKALWNEHFSL
jgi:hypothetical protein